MKVSNATIANKGIYKCVAANVLGFNATTVKVTGIYVLPVRMLRGAQWRTQEKISGRGFKVMASLVGGPGAEPPDAGEFSKIS